MTDLTAKPILGASVRDVVAFVLRSGDLGGTGGFAGRNRALEGTRGHQRLQKKRPTGYQPEVPVEWRHEEDDFVFELKGRIDGVLVQDHSLQIEEIKTVHNTWTGPADRLHWGQAKIYAFLYAQENHFNDVTIQITYVELGSGETVEFHQWFATETLKAFFDAVLGEYLEWIRDHWNWCQVRNISIQALGFPFQKYRAGQRSLAVTAYRTIKARGKLFVEAPTGIGKTVSVLFPALKAMAEGHSEKIFYVTAKTIGRVVAQETLSTLRTAGLRLRAVTLTAKDKICLNNGQPCDIGTCPYATGYYDRIKAALRDALKSDALTRVEIEDIARKHQVCPFELSLDLSPWVDAVICDYNYVFDPSVSLKRYFDGEKHRYTILVDEAHNLVDRAREMFSAELVRTELLELKKSIEADVPGCARALAKLCRRFAGYKPANGWTERVEALVCKDAPASLGKTLEEFLEQAELWLIRDEQSVFRETLLRAYFQALGFQRTLEQYDSAYVTTYETTTGRLRLFCVDPSKLLHDSLHQTGASVFFSATLRPIDYFRRMLGGEPLDSVLQLTSPFPAANLAVLVQDRISTRFRARSTSYDAVVASIESFIQCRTGNYIVFFSSYAYLADVLERFRQRHPDVRVHAQTSGMTESQREEFLCEFKTDPDKRLVAFAVLGGVFGEGIDLIGDRLLGVIIVGVGLPQICLERELIKERSAKNGYSGFDFAYTFPGMNRVLQAIGRVIRSETDKGVVLLIDERYRRCQYRDLFPAWWQPCTVRSPGEIGACGTEFWDSPIAQL